MNGKEVVMRSSGGNAEELVGAMVEWDSNTRGVRVHIHLSVGRMHSVAR